MYIGNFRIAIAFIMSSASFAVALTRCYVDCMSEKERPGKYISYIIRIVQAFQSVLQTPRNHSPFEFLTFAFCIEDTVKEM